MRAALLALSTVIAALALAAPASAATFSNGTPIVITADAGAANPSPSPIDVSGVTGVVTDVNVTLHDGFHQHFDDFDIVLVTPSGRRVLILSDVCAGEVNADLNFSDGAPAAPESSPCQDDSTYSPTGYDPPGDLGDDWPEGTAPDGSDLGDLANEDPNGTWSLYVSDDSEHPDDAGQFGGGWSVDIDTREPAAVAFSVATQTVTEGSSVVVDVVRTGGNPLYPGAVTVATSSGTASAGSDFLPMSQRLEFAAGETTRRIEVPVLADGAGEPAQDFSVMLGNAEGDARVGTPGAVGITIPADPGGVPDDLPTGNEDPPPPGRFEARNSIRAPRAARCKRRGETIRIRPRMPAGVAIVRSEVYVNGKKVEDNVDEAAVAPIVLTMRGRRMRVRIRLTAHDGRRIGFQRTYRSCKRESARKRGA